jgi:hypothetical protein
MRLRALLGPIAIALALAGCGSGTQRIPVPPEPNIVSTAFRCPELSPDAAPPGHGPLPYGATSALICDGSQGRDWVAPRDHLDTGLDALVTLINHAPATHAACETSLTLPSYVMVFRYVGGTRTVTADQNMCLLQVGGSEHKRASQVWTRYLALLRKQRLQAKAPVERSTEGCLKRGTNAPVSPLADLATFRPHELCRVNRRGYLLGDPPELPAAALQELSLDVAGRAYRPYRHTSCHPGAASLLLTGSDEWNDTVAFHIQCGQSMQVAYGDNPFPGRSLQPGTAHMLKRFMASR